MTCVQPEPIAQILHDEGTSGLGVDVDHCIPGAVLSGWACALQDLAQGRYALFVDKMRLMFSAFYWFEPCIEDSAETISAFLEVYGLLFDPNEWIVGSGLVLRAMDALVADERWWRTDVAVHPRPVTRRPLRFLGLGLPKVHVFRDITYIL